MNQGLNQRGCDSGAAPWGQGTRAGWWLERAARVPSCRLRGTVGIPGPACLENMVGCLLLNGKLSQPEVGWEDQEDLTLCSQGGLLSPSREG